MDTKVYYENSNDQQKQFIRDKIMEDLPLCQSCLVDEMLKKDVFSYEDIQQQEKDLFDSWRDMDLCICEELLNEVGLDPTWSTQDWDCIESSCDDQDKTREFMDLERAVKEKQQELRDEREIFEWWACGSKWIADRLLDHGECVLDNDYGYWWGRQCTGQAIKLDRTFWEIYQEGVRMRDTITDAK